VDQQTLVIGHRGASGYRPEHTASAYELAFALGADAVEPDVVLSLDGVPVVRHENEISGTTDVASHAEFADRRTTREVDGVAHTGWFTEDFTWPELQTLRAVERLPGIRPSSASFDGRFGLLRLRDVLRIAEEAGGGAVVELKHGTHFAAAGLPLAEAVAREIDEAGWGWAGRERLTVESFEQTVLGELRATGLDARWVYLLEDSGTAFDLVARLGADAPGYADQLTDSGLRTLAGSVDGISVDKATILPRDVLGVSHGASDVVDRAHAAGLEVFTWTLRAENRFLPRNFRVGHDKAAFGRWEEEFRAILATGVDGVFADQPDLAVAARSAVGGAAYT
jgi:glycerophosphoryl diester phosphodiesterase